MRIVQIAAIQEAVPPTKYGGTELMVSTITEGMVEHGHEVFLLASGDSKTAGTLVPLVPQSLRSMYTPDQLPLWRDYYNFSTLADILSFIRKIKPDIVHNHLSWMVVLFERFIKCPVITTVHGPLREVYERETYLKSPKSHYVSISNSQRQLLPDINWIGTIHHGIDVNKFGFNEKPQDYFVFLGRISPEKGIAEICRMIKQTDYKLKIAAIIDPVDRMYFEAEVNPLIDGEQIEFLGEIDHAQKNTLLGGARALLLWANWEEPFGLPVIESMACGTPVIVNPRGSMPELIVDGKTGIFVHTVDEMKEQLQNIGVIDRAACRAHVTEHFSKERMVDEYLSLANGLYNE